jgi:hypothetical protein
VQQHLLGTSRIIAFKGLYSIHASEIGRQDRKLRSVPKFFRQRQCPRIVLRSLRIVLQSMVVITDARQRGGQAFSIIHLLIQFKRLLMVCYRLRLRELAEIIIHDSDQSLQSGNAITITGCLCYHKRRLVLYECLRIIAKTLIDLPDVSCRSDYGIGIADFLRHCKRRVQILHGSGILAQSTVEGSYIC